jgi:hypothetical protein
MKKIFEPSDFESKHEIKNRIFTFTAADIANAKIEKLMADWPVVYFSSENALGEIKGSAALLIGKKEAGDTHQARLAFIEPIKRECKHEPVVIYEGEIPWAKQKCKHCGVELEAEWKVKGE